MSASKRRRNARWGVRAMARATVCASKRPSALAAVYRLAAAVASPLARASALPCVLSLISRNTRKPNAIIGTITMTTKKVVRRERKLMTMPDP